MSDSSRSSVQGDADDVDVDATLLYDILVYREWPPISESKNPDAAAAGPDAQPDSAEGWKDRVSSWVKWSSKIDCLPNFLLQGGTA